MSKITNIHEEQQVLHIKKQANTNIPIVGFEPTSLAMPVALQLSYMGFEMWF